MEFEWDESKAVENLRKHGVGFDEAVTAFFDPLGALRMDDEHSEEEERFVFLGRSALERLLVTSFTERGSRRRIISSRPAGRREVKDYEEGI